MTLVPKAREAWVESAKVMACQGVWSGERDPSGLPTKGLTMSDKSPRQSPSKKSGKSIKEKRADKRAKEAESTGIETALHGKKR